MRLFDKLFSATVGSQISDSPEMATVLCIDPVLDHAAKEWELSLANGRNFDSERFPFCRPPWRLSFVEGNTGPGFKIPGVRQIGMFTMSLQEQYKINQKEVSDLINHVRAMSVEVFCSTIVLNVSEHLLVSAQGIWGVDDRGGLSKVKYAMAIENRRLLPDHAIEALVLASNFALESLFLSFTFANCSNVKLEDVSEEVAPLPKIRRRLKLPEVKRYTLNIAGHIARPSRDYNEGPKGVMPFHLCRGHFATYTAERPMFGNPKLVGRYWHPPHMKGKKENGEIIKDYSIVG